ncbi:RNA polymerase sigma factor [Achromobacter sp. RTa]|uniref:RNA polymerase sigma factor n=1 Tax=Achromobacter sp. RTa TaxID=1532557 RepID=UPI000A8F4294|nr:RNA polymerase sigma factor [Achromobacter sp. RTa]
MNSCTVAMHPAPIAASHHAPPPASPRLAPSDLIGQLVREQGIPLRRFVGRHIGNHTEADDITQQAFVEMSLSYAHFRGDSKLSTWLYGIALNLIRNHLARAPERRYTFVDESQLEPEACPRPDPSAQAELRQTISVLDLSMGEIPQGSRQVLLLICVEHLSYEDAAARLGVPVGTVRSRLSRARALLRTRMQAHGVRLDD